MVSKDEYKYGLVGSVLLNLLLVSLMLKLNILAEIISLTFGLWLAGIAMYGITLVIEKLVGGEEDAVL